MASNCRRLLMLVCLLDWGFCAASTPKTREDALLKSTERLVTEFFNVVNASGVQTLTDRSVPVEQAMKKGRITIQIPPNNPGNPLQAAEFNLNKEGEPRLVLKQSLIDLYPKHRPFVFAVLMHEVAHASDYLKQPEVFFARSKQESLERYLYEMDAMFIEAVFIRDISRAKGWNLSPFETYLIESLEKDNLASCSTAFLMVDMEFVYTFYKARSSSEPLQILGVRLVQAGQTMKEDFRKNEGSSEWQRYRDLVSIRTFVTMGSELAASLVAHKDPKVDPKDTIEKHVPGFDPIILELQDLLEKHAAGLDFRTTLVTRFNAFYQGGGKP